VDLAKDPFSVVVDLAKDPLSVVVDLAKDPLSVVVDLAKDPLSVVVDPANAPFIAGPLARSTTLIFNVDAARAVPPPPRTVKI
jgi:hypothetical protein